jgi:DNA-binding response OmpR family regulator
LFESSNEDLKHSIVLVEDDIDVSNMLAGYFKLAKYRVYKTSSAIDCLDKLKELENKADVVLVNGSIAADRGPMLIVKIKDSNPNIKIFAISDSDNNKTRVLDYGADEFAIKPLSPTTVVEKISGLLMKKPIEAK